MTVEMCWGVAGYATPEQHAARREYELHAADPCTCKHRRDEHFQDERGCWHHGTRYANSSKTWTELCECSGFEEGA